MIVDFSHFSVWWLGTPDKNKNNGPLMFIIWCFPVLYTCSAVVALSTFSCKLFSFVCVSLSLSLSLSLIKTGVHLVISCPSLKVYIKIILYWMCTKYWYLILWKFIFNKIFCFLFIFFSFCFQVWPPPAA